MSDAGKRLTKAAKEVASFARGETSMSVAMRKAGLDPRVVALDRALALFRNQNGTEQVAHERVRLAFEQPGEGLHRDADKTTPHLPSARQPNGDEGGHNKTADDGHNSRASLSPTHRGGRGHANGAEQGQATTAPPVRDPSPSEAGRILGQLPKRSNEEKLRTLRHVQKVNREVILRIDGDDIMDFTVGRALSDGRRFGRNYYALWTLGNMYKHCDHTKTFREVSTESEVKAVVNQAKAFADARH